MMIPLYHLNFDLVISIRAGTEKEEVCDLLKSTLNRLDLIQVHIVSEKNEIETIHQQLNLFILIKSQHSYNRIKIEILTIQNDY